MIQHVRNVRFKKKKVMEALEPLRKEDVGAQRHPRTIRGRNDSRESRSSAIRRNRASPQHPANDTFIAAKLQIDDYFWRGVPFYIRTGKRMKEKSTRIVIEFKEPLKQPRIDER